MLNPVFKQRISKNYVFENLAFVLNHTIQCLLKKTKKLCCWETIENQRRCMILI